MEVRWAYKRFIKVVKVKRGEKTLAFCFCTFFSSLDLKKKSTCISPRNYQLQEWYCCLVCNPNLYTYILQCCWLNNDRKHCHIMILKLAYSANLATTSVKNTQTKVNFFNFSICRIIFEDQYSVQKPENSIFPWISVFLLVVALKRQTHTTTTQLLCTTLFEQKNN